MFLALSVTGRIGARKRQQDGENRRPRQQSQGDPDKHDDRLPVLCGKVTLKVKAADLFNISAYQPGDLQRFFKDARSRERYLPWAAALVSAERFHAQYGKADSADHVWEATS